MTTKISKKSRRIRWQSDERESQSREQFPQRISNRLRKTSIQRQVIEALEKSEPEEQPRPRQLVFGEIWKGTKSPTPQTISTRSIYSPHKTDWMSKGITTLLFIGIILTGMYLFQIRKNQERLSTLLIRQEAEIIKLRDQNTSLESRLESILKEKSPDFEETGDLQYLLDQERKALR